MMLRLVLLLGFCVCSQANVDQQVIIENIGIKDIVKFIINLRFNKSELGLDPADHAAKFGYPAERHYVTTEDGYNLLLHRIPHGRNSTEGKRPVVFMQPGLICSAAAFVDVGPERALGFLLADRGYDVWIGNVRGTTFSRNHTIYDASKNKKFWQYSWHEMGMYDIPTMIDYILEETQQPKLNYIGHSEGTTVFFVMASEMPEYNAKINTMVALAPVGIMDHMNHPILRPLSKHIEAIVLSLKLMGIHDLLPYSKSTSDLAARYCNENNTQTQICALGVDLVIGYNPEEFYLPDLAIIMNHFPGGSSVRQVQHYAQVINSGKFQKFDFGKRKNKKVYGQPKPPEYDLTKITAPVYLMYGDGDTFAAPEDAKTMHNLIPNSELYRVDYEKFNHGDFLWAKDVIPLLYNKIFSILKSVN